MIKQDSNPSFFKIFIHLQLFFIKLNFFKINIII